MCTVVVWADNDQAVVSSRNMDWFQPMETRLWVVPRGRQQPGAGEGDPKPLNWTSKYGSVIASVYEIGTSDGMNEKGLAAHMLWLAETDDGPRDPKMDGLAVSLWAQYYLDNFATVAEAVADYEENPYQVVPADVAGRIATIHLQLTDATGDVAVLEILGGEMQIHHGKQYTVLTNSPPFSQQLEHLQDFEGFGGTEQLPGNTEAAARFVRAAYYRDRLLPPENRQMALAEILSVLRNVAQPYGKPAEGQPNIAPTIWRSTMDHTNLTYFFESTSSPYLIWLDLKQLDFSEGAPVKVLNLKNMADRIGDQTDSLVEEPLFRFSLPPEDQPEGAASTAGAGKSSQ